MKICHSCHNKGYFLLDNFNIGTDEGCPICNSNKEDENHLNWLQDTNKTLTTIDGIPIKVFELNHTNNEAILSSWAKHFRNHYCLDILIDEYRDGTGKSRKDFFNDLVFPSKDIRPGPSTRAGDFGEILVSDYLEYILHYWVPRTRFSDRQNRSNPTQGVDVLGLKMLDPRNKSIDDELLLYEVKARLTSKSKNESKDRLEIAIEHSSKDFNIRKGESLYALKRYYRGEKDKIQIIQRFQNSVDNPYKELSGASAIILTSAVDDSLISQVDASQHPNKDNLQLIIISGDNLMDLVHHLYERGANEA